MSWECARRNRILSRSNCHNQARQCVQAWQARLVTPTSVVTKLSYTGRTSSGVGLARPAALSGSSMSRRHGSSSASVRIGNENVCAMAGRALCARSCTGVCQIGLELQSLPFRRMPPRILMRKPVVTRSEARCGGAAVRGHRYCGRVTLGQQPR